MKTHKFTDARVWKNGRMRTFCGSTANSENCRSAYKFVTCEKCLALRPKKLITKAEFEKAFIFNSDAD